MFLVFYSKKDVNKKSFSICRKSFLNFYSAYKFYRKTISNGNLASSAILQIDIDEKGSIRWKRLLLQEDLK